MSMKKVLSFVFLTGLFVFSNGCASATPKEVPFRAMGKADAAVTLYEYVSMGCSHCAEFNNTVLPKIKERYVDTGKVRVVLVDYPLDGLSLKAAALARCMPEEQFFPFISTLYKNETSWLTTRDSEKVLMQYAMLGGLPQDQAKACLHDNDLMDAIVAKRTEATEKYDVKATPSFVINNGDEKVTGALTFDDMAALLDRHLKKAEKNKTSKK